MGLFDFLKRDTENGVTIDVETTGFSNNDEILSVSAVDDDGNVLFDSRFRPEHRKSWKSAEAVNGISPSDVEDCDLFSKHSDELQDIIDNADVVRGYNVGFDKRMLENQGISFEETDTFDVYREYKDKHGSAKLEEAASNYGIEFNAHDSLEDAQATRKLHKKLKR